jgi:hypothetical protein
MNVNVFVTRVDGQLQRDLLAVPLAPTAVIPPQYRTGWTYYATVDTGDRMFGDVDATAIEAEIAASGFAVVKPKVEDQR